ncbi:hypothetical protein [Lactiplantibacillus plantarum]|nr:hypothetical protein [Lactiplantibacillus plantarum]MCB7152004.1 hypothetical protein [Lactiplantibacillus plantarum]MCB7170166.1 hypothetical protein [Lactiplantibacillus plantarum]MCG0659947.1 osmotically inducible protein OsmC [Lactiplantibacillus plantarum]
MTKYSVTARKTNSSLQVELELGSLGASLQETARKLSASNNLPYGFLFMQ